MGLASKIVAQGKGGQLCPEGVIAPRALSDIPLHTSTRPPSVHLFPLPGIWGLLPDGTQEKNEEQTSHLGEGGSRDDS